MARHGAVFCFGGAFTEHHHALDASLRADPALRPAAASAPAAPAGGELRALGAAALHEERLVDRLVADAHTFIIRVRAPQVGAGLLPGPQVGQQALDLAPRPRGARQLRRPRPNNAPHSALASAPGAVLVSPPLAFTSRAMVDGERLSRAAITRKEMPICRPRLISSGSAGERRNGDLTGSRRARTF